jgi:integrase
LHCIFDITANSLPIASVTPNRSKKNTKTRQEWPYIRWAETEKQWKVDARTKDGGSRRFFDTKAEAETFAQQCRVQKENSGTSAFGNAELAKYGTTVQHAIDFYLAHLRATERSVTIEKAVEQLLELRRAAGRNGEYLRGMSIRLGRFAHDHKESLVAAFDTADLNRWLISLPHAPATRNTFRRDLVTFFSFSTDHGYCEKNIAEKTDMATDIDKPVGILTPTQASALLAACDEDLRPYAAIGLFAGLRAAELERLDWSEIDLEGGHIEVTAAKSKTRRRRLVPIASNLGAWLRPSAALAGSISITNLRRRFECARKVAGITEWPNNALRHSYGSYRLAQCHDAARVSLEMGNSPAMVFAHYRELVKPKDAGIFWNIAPEAK